VGVPAQLALVYVLSVMVLPEQVEDSEDVLDAVTHPVGIVTLVVVLPEQAVLLYTFSVKEPADTFSTKANTTNVTKKKDMEDIIETQKKKRKTSFESRHYSLERKKNEAE